ncbi:MAG TPA: DUF1702 family protein [Pyrinomonadaceae bacterium]|nr:DUF1702 family protein [Pyrinomonadaceae bacterium]
MQSSEHATPRAPFVGRLRQRLFGLPPEEASFARRGFLAADPRARRRLESVGGLFLRGYHAALEETSAASLARRLSQTEDEPRGFAFEGAAMGLALLDALTPWGGGRWRDFTQSFGAPHVYMMHVGYGWALARLRRRVESSLARLDPLLGWLAVDGYGFHEGYFKWRRYVERRESPGRLGGYARRAFDQGLGRSVWFVRGAHVGEVARTVDSFEPSRRADLWSGVGLACAYAGGADRADLGRLSEAAGGFRPQLAQGAAFAAKTRERAGNPAAHTETACAVICRLAAREAAEVTDLALRDLRGGGDLPSFEVWRRRIQNHLAREVAAA